MELRTLLYEKHGPICTITMSRPEVLNAYNLQMVDELRQVWWDFRDDDSLHVAILTGAGERSFSTGLDAKEIIGKPFASPSLVYAGVPTLTARDFQVWKPVIVAVNGVCCAGGWHFISDADIVVCSENATFFDTHVEIGLVNPVEAVDLMSKVPPGEVMRMVLCGRDYRMTAQRALQVGLATEVVPLNELIPTAMTIARQIAEKSLKAASGSLEVMWSAINSRRTPSYPLGMALLNRDMLSQDRREGFDAFVQKRKPRWTDRT